MHCSPAVQFYFQQFPGSGGRFFRAVIARRAGHFLSGSKARVLAPVRHPEALPGELYRGSMQPLLSEESWSE